MRLTKEKFDLNFNWIVVSANWACALFALGQFEAIMYTLNWICIGFSSIATISLILLYAHIRKNNLGSHYKPISPSDPMSYFLAAANIVAFLIIGWYWITATYSALISINLIFRACYVNK